MSGQNYMTNEKGRNLSAKNLSKIFRLAYQPMMRFWQCVDTKDFLSFGGGRGHTFTIGQAQGKIKEYGNSVPVTNKLKTFSEGPIMEIVRNALRNDCIKTMEKAVYEEFAKTPLIITPTNGNDVENVTLGDTGSTNTVNNSPLTLKHVTKIVTLMEERNIPPYQGEYYFCIARPKTFEVLRDDLREVHKYQDQSFGPIMRGEIGQSTDGVRFLKQTSIPSKNWQNGKSDEAYFFGQDTVIEAVVNPPEILTQIGQDYNRITGIAWLTLEGFALTRPNKENASILKWDSKS